MEPHLFSNYPCVERNTTRSSYDYIYLSPHLDDVALSCSGTICQQKTQGSSILMATIFAGTLRRLFS